MKKFSILITAAMVLIFIMPAFAGKPIPESEKIVISKYMELVSTGTDYIIMTVPTDKEFILTDIVAGDCHGDISVKEKTEFSSDFKLRTYMGDYGIPNYSIHLTSGIPFSPGSDVVFNATFGCPQWYLTITGYLLDHLGQ